MITVVCFLWYDPSGRHNEFYTYSADYVNRLCNMLGRNLSLPYELVCVTDIPDGIDDRVRIVPLPEEVKSLRAEFPKLYVFHPDAQKIFGPRILMLDLDTVIVGPLDELAGRKEPLIAWSAPDNNAGRFNTSMVLFDAGQFPEVWNDYEGVESVAAVKAAGMDGWEQDWVSLKVGERGKTWARRGEGIEPFYQIRHSGLPDSARIVFFNGRRSPAMKDLQATHPWIAEHWH